MHLIAQSCKIFLLSFFALYFFSVQKMHANPTLDDSSIDSSTQEELLKKKKAESDARLTWLTDTKTRYHGPTSSHQIMKMRWDDKKYDRSLDQSFVAKGRVLHVTLDGTLLDQAVTLQQENGVQQAQIKDGFLSLSDGQILGQIVSYTLNGTMSVNPGLLLGQRSTAEVKDALKGAYASARLAQLQQVHPSGYYSNLNKMITDAILKECTLSLTTSNIDDDTWDSIKVYLVNIADDDYRINDGLMSSILSKYFVKLEHSRDYMANPQFVRRRILSIHDTLTSFVSMKPEDFDEVMNYFYEASTACEERAAMYTDVIASFLGFKKALIDCPALEEACILSNLVLKCKQDYVLSHLVKIADGSSKSVEEVEGYYKINGILQKVIEMGVSVENLKYDELAHNFMAYSFPVSLEKLLEAFTPERLITSVSNSTIWQKYVYATVKDDQGNELDASQIRPAAKKAAQEALIRHDYILRHPDYEIEAQLKL